MTKKYPSSMDETDKRILNAIQSDFPISPRPYDVLGERLGLPAGEVMERIQALRRQGVIRRIGGNFHSSRLNFSSTLCAARVPEDKIDRFVAAVNRYPGVTHNYLRNHAYNVWFTFIAENAEEIRQALASLAREMEIPEILDLPAVRTFKIKVDFDVA